MKHIEELCGKYNIALCYIFGSQQEQGRDVLEGRQLEVTDPESDIDFAVLFKTQPENSLETYASLSLDLQELVNGYFEFEYKADKEKQLSKDNT